MPPYLSSKTMLQFSLRNLLLTMIVLGSAPFWFEHFLIPFGIILVISFWMAVRGFSDSNHNDINFS